MKLKNLILKKNILNFEKNSIFEKKKFNCLSFVTPWDSSKKKFSPFGPAV